MLWREQVINRQLFGKTGHGSTRTIFGGAAITERFTDREAGELLELLFRYGINHIDTAPIYGKGNSEALIGHWMERHRARFFLATKTGERGYREAWDSIRASLRKLQVEYVDLIQLHNLTDQAEWEIALGPYGALKACVEARQSGLVRFIGVTGHGLMAPQMHLKSLERFPFDSVLLPWNYLLSKNSDYRDGFLKLLALCAEREVAVQTIKSLARRSWSGNAHTADTWYEPLSSESDIDRAVNWCLSHEQVFLNTVGDARALRMVLDSASRRGQRPGDGEMEAMAVDRDMGLIFSEGGMIF
jgi:aryl-alcohol dehydrogenase-like predicted oxidoreductase